MNPSQDRSRGSLFLSRPMFLFLILSGVIVAFVFFSLIGSSHPAPSSSLSTSGITPVMASGQPTLEEDAMTTLESILGQDISRVNDVQ